MLATLVLTASTAATAAPIAYTLDPAHTQVVFGWNHLQYSHPEAAFDDVSGTLMWDADDITRSSIDVTMAVGSVHSHVAALDDKLKSAEFLDVAKFPKATFASTRVEKVDDAGELRIHGNLTVHGVTRPVTLAAHVNRVGKYPMLDVPAAGFSAHAVIKRSDFGVGTGIPYVGDDLDVRISAEALEAAGFAKAMAAIKASEGTKK
jgi:polyisoprenoid-binding protein YceI